MNLAIVTLLLLSLLASSLGNGVRLGGRKEWPMVDEMEVEESNTETTVPTSIMNPPAAVETVVPTFMGSSGTSDKTCCSCPEIPEGATEEEISLIMADMDEGCSICEEDGDGPNRHRNLQGWVDYISNHDARTRSLQFGCTNEPYHQLTPINGGSVYFRDCAGLSGIRYVPEKNNDPPHPMPANNKSYDVDGLCFSGYSTWWKIPNHCEVRFECDGKTLEVLSNGKFSVEPYIDCCNATWCAIWATHWTPWPKSVPSPTWREDKGGWPDCPNAGW